jgi:cell surface protein SprA
MRPFMGFDATLKNSLLAKFEYNRDRNLSLSLTNYQVTESPRQGVRDRHGLPVQEREVPLRSVGGTRPKSDLNLRVDLSLRTTPR